MYRFWRDLGYAAGAVIAGLVAAALGLSAAVVAAVAVLLAGMLIGPMVAGTAQPVGPRSPAGRRGQHDAAMG